jgi:hypothetical protein
MIKDIKNGDIFQQYKSYSNPQKYRTVQNVKYCEMSPAWIEL